MLRTLSTVAILLSAMPAMADDVTDTLQSAIEAYTDGDIQYALEEIAFATQLMKAMKAGTLSGFLPEGQDGWTREIDEDEGRALGMMGGTGAVAEYSKDNQSFTIQIMADSPMIASFGAIFGNAGMMANMGKIVRVGREKFLDQDGELTGVIGNRTLIQANGADAEPMIQHLKTIDFKALSNFGS